MSEAVKTCPFCGCTPTCTSVTDKSFASGFGRVVICEFNDACPVGPMTDSFETEAEAVAAWNTRKGQSLLREGE